LQPDEPPPIPGRWGLLYGLVIAGLLVMIVLCALVTRWGAAR
jgi:tetrahydromethanopterin S-methyltransferase subunit G